MPEPALDLSIVHSLAVARRSLALFRLVCRVQACRTVLYHTVCLLPVLAAAPDAASHARRGCHALWSIHTLLKQVRPGIARTSRPADGRCGRQRCRPRGRDWRSPLHRRVQHQLRGDTHWADCTPPDVRRDRRLQLLHCRCGFGNRQAGVQQVGRAWR